VPLTCASAEEILGEHDRLPGTLVGRALPGVELRIVPISDAELSEARALQAGEIGEIAARGAVVSRSYDGEREAEALTKIPGPDGCWHRMGDLGYLDAAGRLWFCGRKSERVATGKETLFTACVEPWFERHPAVRRVALVRAGGKAVVVVEPRFGRASAKAAAEILSMRGAWPVERVLFKRRLPLDSRHGAKIQRGELARWACARLP
jgi:acyl-CoA synthetase (AMP-forming)/AMP-acid ligase II